MPKISIICPVYNGEKYVEAAVASVVKQSYSDWELLVGDDGSRDRTREIVASFRDPRIRLFPRDSNPGIFKNCNFLMGKASGELIRFLCQDDILEPHCLETEVRFFERFPNVGMSYCAVYVIDTAGNESRQNVTGALPYFIRPELSRQQFFYHGNVVGCLSSACVRRSALNSVGIFDAEYDVAGDYELWSRLCDRFDLGIIHERILRVRVHPEQASVVSRWAPKNIRERRQVYRLAMARMPRENRRFAHFYRRLRLHVYDVHFFFHALRRRGLRVAMQVLRAIGPLDFAIDLVGFVLSLGNRVQLLRPRWVRDAEGEGPYPEHMPELSRARSHRKAGG